MNVLHLSITEEQALGGTQRNVLLIEIKLSATGDPSSHRLIMAPSEYTYPARAKRSNSISSDLPSTTSGYGGLVSPPTTVAPEPAFVAASAASQIVTNDHDSQSDSWFDQNGIEPSGETALVAAGALQLVNRFLDQLLFNFLSVAKATSLAALRPAVIEVLKPKLAKDAIQGAEQELHEYLGGGDDEGLMAFQNGPEQDGDWDLELVWKRTRLRCMVYSSLGDMEEDDEDFWTEKEHLEDSNSAGSGVVSPAVAIFLTSILEFMGEQALVVAGHASYLRLRTKLEKEARDGTREPADIADRVIVDESDTERVALDRTLGRLWRGWKKRIRSPTASISMARSFSREITSAPESAALSDGVEGEPHSLATVLAEYEDPANIPLPISDEDIREIEIPGLARQIEDEDDFSDFEEIQHPRPQSVHVFGFYGIHPLAPISPNRSTTSILKTRKRSYSSPTPAPLEYPFSSKRQKASDEEENVDPATPDSDPEAQEQVDTSNEDHSDSKGIVAGAVSVVVAAGTAAVATVTALANGEAPQTETETEIDARSEVSAEEFVEEEPQIMTSSRISIGGSISPPISTDEAREQSRHSSIRTSSVHSVRIVDVQSPKSPPLSRAGSVDVKDRAPATAPPTIIHSQISDLETPRVSSPISRLPNGSPNSRGTSLSAMHVRNSAGESISEVEEAGEPESDPITAVPSDLAAAMAGVDFYPSSTPPPIPEISSARVAPPQVSAPGSFVLSAAPPARNNREPTSSEDSQPRQIHSPIGHLETASRTTGIDNGVSPLTPLREMMEGPQDTSDEASSVAQINDAQSANDHFRSVSGSTSTPPYMRKSGDQQRPVRGPPSTIRNSPPRPSRDESLPKGQSQRSIHTSASSTSSVSNKLKAMRTSEDSSQSAGEDKSQSFEQLIRSDQTIQYTLTPENMRNIEGPDRPHSPRLAAPVISEVSRPPTSRSHSSSVTRLSALRSNPPTDVSKASPKSNSKQFPSYTPSPVISNKSTGGSRLRPNAPQARDARVDRDSIGDFADFIRSTGPANSFEPAGATLPQETQTHRGSKGTVRATSGSVRRVSASPSLPKRSESSAGRSKLQAREAAVSRGDSISDLIDFVRSGPRLDRDNHRIPRTVAPFRSTMDSDQMSGAGGGRAIDAAFPDSGYSQASASVDGSVNSQSALLGNASRNKLSPTQNRTTFDEEDMMPKRKTRRVRDPYAIDFSDEGDDSFDAGPVPRTKPAVKEESLADFLRNVSPPDEPTTTSVFDSVPKPNGKNAVKKKSSTPSLMSRFGRRESTSQMPPKPKTSGQESTAPPVRRSSYTPIHAKLSTTSLPTASPANNGGGAGNYSIQANSARTRAPKINYQPREAVLPSKSKTDDLAEFLMRSEPPMQSQPQTFTPAALQKEESGTFQRMFGRKKVH